MMRLPLCEFHSSQVMRNKNKKNLDDNTHIGRLIIIYNYSNAPSIAHSVYRIDNMVNTAYTSRDMRESRKLCQRGSNFDNFFDEGREDQNITISGPSSPRYVI